MKAESLQVTKVGSKYVVQIITDDPTVMDKGMEAMQNPMDFEIKIHREKRSLDANAYYWVLVGKLAKAIGVAPEAIYRTHVKDVGAYQVVCVADKAVGNFLKIWESNGLGWFAETFPSKIANCTNIKAYYGSSCYDSRQMSLLIDKCVQDAKNCGVETATPEELARMVSEWGDNVSSVAQKNG